MATESFSFDWKEGHIFL